MLKIEITGNTSDELYANAVTMLYMVTRGGQAIAVEREAAAKNAALAEAMSITGKGEAAPEVEPLENPKASDPLPAEKKTRKPKAAPVIEDKDPFGLGLETAEPAPAELTLGDIRKRVQDIIAAHSEQRKVPMDECIAYVRKLFAPFGIKMAADLKPEQWTAFYAASQAYLDGTAPR